MHPDPSWIEYVESWHEFFLMAGTAAVTLAGLLFVAMSIHVETLIHESRSHLVELARANLSCFIMVLVLSLMMLVPGQSQRVVGAQLLIVGLVFLAFTVRLLFSAPRTGHADFSMRLFRRRLTLPLIGYAWVALVGVMLISGADRYSMQLIIGAICMLLGNASGTSWDLLVRVAKLKRSEAQRAEE
jgi:hypothetical protein